MAKGTLTGSRIRERRVAQAMRQADLAKKAGISASYLNLIEHNRRRIGGKLLLDIAQVLGVEPALLTEGAGAALMASLREAASAVPAAQAELDRVDEFAGRFPGWAEVLSSSQKRISALERSVETLTDRMTHDPHLAASLHEMLSTVTAIRSAASILAEPGDIDPEWQARFHRNIYEDSARLTETSRGLVTYLEADDAEATETGAPQEELDAVLAAAGHYVQDLEEGGTVHSAQKRLGTDLSAPARELLGQWLQRYQKDAQAVPQSDLARAIQKHGADPAALAEHLDADPACVMRRLAAMPEDVLPEGVGLAISDASGVLTYRKPLPEFPMPRFGSACPLWPLYRALNRPMVILSHPVVQTGRPGSDLWVDALAVPVGRVAVNRDPLFEAVMLVRPMPTNTTLHEEPLELGSSCRVCARAVCPGRREPSILVAGA